MRSLPLLCVLVSGLVLAQTPAKARPADAGVLALDAGVAEAARPACTPAAPDPEVARLRADVAELKALIQKQSSQADATTATLEKLTKQVSSLRTDFSEAEQRKADAEQRQADRRAAVGQAVNGLAYAQQQLATGSSNVGEALRTAESVLTGSSLWAVQSARAALAQGDLSAARIWLAIAASEANTPSP